MGIIEVIARGLGKSNGSAPQTSNKPTILDAVPTHNPFPLDREGILAFDSELMSVAATGNHQQFNRTLQSFLIKLTLYNSNISRFLVRAIRENSNLENATFSHEDADAMKELFLEHNSAYIVIRGLIKDLQQEAPLNESKGIRSDDLSILDDDQTRIVYGSLLNIRLSLSVIEDIWVKIRPFEDAVFGINNRSK